MCNGIDLWLVALLGACCQVEQSFIDKYELGAEVASESVATAFAVARQSSGKRAWAASFRGMAAPPVEGDDLEWGDDQLQRVIGASC